MLCSLYMVVYCSGISSSSNAFKKACLAACQSYSDKHFREKAMFSSRKRGKNK